jgi:glucose-6-phosphate 1-epimerase
MPQSPPHSQATLTQVSLQQRDELPVLKICNRYADAAIALQGAQILEYTPRGKYPLIWLSPAAEYRRGQSQRGGIPVCWPWFGNIERNPIAARALTHGDNLPAHGLVRTRDWTIHSIQEHEYFTEIILNFVTDTLSQIYWPHSAELQLRITIGQSLRLELTTRNKGTQTLFITQALHTYFAISAIDNVRVTGFENSRCIDTLDNWREHNQQGAIHFSGETDRIYLDVPQAVQLHDSGWNRTIHLQAANSASAVIWNPWIEKSKRLSQFMSDGWRDMVCIETANVLDDMIEVASQGKHILTLEIHSEE